MGLDRDIYGSTIEVQLLDFIRGERKFDSLEELKEQISRDKELRRDFLRKNSNKKSLQSPHPMLILNRYEQTPMPVVR